MKNQLIILVVMWTLCLGTVVAQPSRVNVDGAWYTNGQTVYIDCGKTNVNVAIDPIIGPNPYDNGNPAIAPLQTQTSSNFSTSDTDSDIGKVLNLDANHQDGFLKVSINNFSPGQYLIVNITQKPVAPTLTNIPSLCNSGQTGTLSAQLNYNFQSSHPANLVWQASGGVTVNSSGTFTQNNATNSSVNVALNSPGTVIVYATIPGCNNLQGPSSQSVYFGRPQIANVTIDNVVNPGPYPVSSGSTHYISTTSAFNYVPSYSLSTSTNSGDLTLSLTGVNYGNAEIYAYGSVGNASINITASNSCGSDYRSVTFYIPPTYGIAPNPAQNKMAVSFASTDDETTLPDRLDIVSEKDMRTVKSVDVKEVYRKKTFRNGNEIGFDVSDLARGTYYLRVTNSQQTKDKQVEMTRLILN